MDHRGADGEGRARVSAPEAVVGGFLPGCQVCYPVTAGKKALSCTRGGEDTAVQLQGGPCYPGSILTWDLCPPQGHRSLECPLGLWEPMSLDGSEQVLEALGNQDFCSAKT